MTNLCIIYPSSIYLRVSRQYSGKIIWVVSSIINNIHQWRPAPLTKSNLTSTQVWFASNCHKGQPAVPSWASELQRFEVYSHRQAHRTLSCQGGCYFAYWLLPQTVSLPKFSQLNPLEAERRKAPIECLKKGGNCEQEIKTYLEIKWF